MRWILEKILQIPHGEEDELVRALLLRLGLPADEEAGASEAWRSSIEPEREARRYEVWDRMYF